MGGKGGGGGDYYQQPPDTSGYGTPEEARASLARETPLDMSQYQQTINVQRAAADATAPEPPPVVSTGTPTTSPLGTGESLANAVLKPPEYWKGAGMQPRKATDQSSVVTTQT